MTPTGEVMDLYNLRFNFGYLIEASPGTSSDIEVDYPQVRVEDITLNELDGKFRATRTGEGILIRGRFHSNATVECVRCLDDTLIPITAEVEEIFYHPPSLAPDDPGTFTIGRDGNADLGPLVRELTLLGAPIQPFCREDCLGLCKECGKNLNLGDCDCEIDDVDPRFAVLKQLLNDDPGDRE